MKHWKKLAAAMLLCGAVALGSTVGASAIEVSVTTDGIAYEGEVRLVNQSTYVSLREFSCAVDNAVVSWDAKANTAYVTTEALTLSAERSGDYLVANGRYLWCDEGIFTDQGVLYVPLRPMAAAFGFDVAWDEDAHTARLTRSQGAITPAQSFYEDADVYWLSRIIHAEAGGESFLGKLAVGSVIMNRMADAEFPNALYDVIFDRKNGVQFTPTVNGQIQNEPSEESVIAAKLCLEGYRLSNRILYFLNPSISTSFWVPQNCTFVVSIGGHDFYA